MGKRTQDGQDPSARAMPRARQPRAAASAPRGASVRATKEVTGACRVTPPLLLVPAGAPTGRSAPAATAHRGIARAAAPAPAMPIAAARHGGVRARFGELRTALSDGWEIVQPIFARPLWSAADDSATAFNFVLRRDRATRLVTVPQGRMVERFIRDRSLVVDYQGT